MFRDCPCIFRSEKLQNESSPNFSNFRPEFCSEFSPNFSRTFRASFRGRRRPEKFHRKSPPFFNAKFPCKHEKNIHKILLESRQSNVSGKGRPGHRTMEMIGGSSAPYLTRTPCVSGTENQPKEEVFGTDIPRTSGGHSRGYPDPELRSGCSKSWKNKHLGADIHDPKVRTSTTLRDFQKLRSEKLWAEFWFSSVPLFCTLFNRGGNRRAFRLPGAGGDHFHCAVEPSPGHIRC